MEQFLLDNAAHYNKLVKAFKSAPAGNKPDETTSPEIVVSARIRPLLDDETEQGFPPCIFPRGDSNTVDLHELRQRSYNYTVDKLFGQDSTTAEIYESLVQPLVPWAWGGGVATLFAYGQTGSGKTFTVSGLEKHVADTLIDGSLDGERKIHVCIIELAGQLAYDLLNNRKQISVLEDSFGTSQLAGALEHAVTDKPTFLELIERAAALRRTVATQKNDSSSRSHAICRIRLENPALPSADDGLLYLVDLAGSEAARDRSAHDTARMKESREINTSLSVLKDCIRGRAMADAGSLAPQEPNKKGKACKPAQYVPFRQSTLTKTLKHVFDPASARACKTVVVACVNPCLADVGATKSTLRYAEMLRVIVPRAKTEEIRPDVPATWDNATLRAWIDQNSGKPPLSSQHLAPTETGAQLLRLPVPEFLTRCLRSSDATEEQAQAFHTKLWKLHVDSQRATAATAPSTTKSAFTPSSSTAAADPEMSRLERLASSADPEPDSSAIPFRDRIRPGMVIAYRPDTVPFQGAQFGARNYAMVMAPAVSLGDRVCDIRGNRVNTQQTSDDKPKYLCAIFTPGLMTGSFTLHVWHQVVIGVDEMEDEALMEFDYATRYFYLTV
ncbi:hypothetical protein QBC47DRAFT_342142 [Echria macrotheca]|uniref:Kinesin motor domain-containing protein n=1 Tax=Echria macrotheca TaxID=438768 RepID=A0AAJ0FD12_9PEZI|nr:hypothetical protein QBC47DRAFT_342142 [Echria macrotheca]